MRVLVTRPQPYGPRLCQKINGSEMRAVYYPTLAFLPPADEDLLKEQLLALDKFQWLIFLSPQAVMQIAPKLPDHLTQVSVRVAAIGLGTANALKEANLPIHCYPERDWTSEGLLNLPYFQNCQNMKIALVKGEGGRKFLAKELVSRGAEVTEMNCYRRVQPSTSLLDSDIMDVIIITSVESLQNLKKMTTNWQQVLDKTLIVISERIKMFAVEIGFKKIVLVENASDEAILTTLRKLP